jgi:hypothetical protein
LNSRFPFQLCKIAFFRKTQGLQENVLFQSHLFIVVISLPLPPPKEGDTFCPLPYVKTYGYENTVATRQNAFVFSK